MNDNSRLDGDPPSAEHTGMPSLRLKLDKGRFAGHTVPLRVLARLEGLEEAVAATARARFFEDQPDRERAPKHFEDAYRLPLASIEEGSVVLEMAAQPQALEMVGVIVTALVAIGGGQDASLPRTAWRGLNRFLQRIDEDETVLLEGPDFHAELPPHLRLAVEEAASKAPASAEVAFALAGRVVGLDREHKDGKDLWRLTVQAREGGQRRALPIESGDVDLCQALQKDKTRLVRAVGTCRRGEEGELMEVLPGLVLSAVAGPRLEARFEQLRNVPEGWWDGEGKAPSRTLLERARRAAWTLVEQGGMDRPHVFPTPEGGVQFEWSRPEGSVQVEVSLEGERLRFAPLALRNGVFDEPEATNDPAVIVAWLRAVMEHA